VEDMMPEPIEAIERSTMRRVYWRLIPLLFFAMFFNYLDRINIGFAGLRMNHDLGFSPGVFGFAGSIFFLGYMLLGIPSNLALSKFGARHWIPVILITWGAIAILTGFVWNSHSFYAVRLCLGIAEAGFLPGLALYSTFWFPAAYRARAIGGYIIAGQFSAVVGGPLSTALMTYCDHVFGLHGWQWMFIFEGAPTILLGLSFLVLLTSRPAQAGWRPRWNASAWRLTKAGIRAYATRFSTAGSGVSPFCSAARWSASTACSSGCRRSSTPWAI
jgi:ACS family tartrate transporter-like MFS transporter